MPGREFRKSKEIVTAWLFGFGMAREVKEVRFELSSEKQGEASHAKGTASAKALR